MKQMMHEFQKTNIKKTYLLRNLKQYREKGDFKILAIVEQNSKHFHMASLYQFWKTSKISIDMP